jgi:hypothetical protein
MREAAIINILKREELDKLVECFETLGWKSSMYVDHDNIGRIYHSPNPEILQMFKGVGQSHFPINVTAEDKFHAAFRDGLNFVYCERKSMSVDEFLDQFNRRYYILL